MKNKSDINNYRYYIFLILVFFMPFEKAYSNEFTGTKFEYLNTGKTNFYGLGFFTSDKRFDAEIEFFMSQKVYQRMGSDAPIHISEAYRRYYFSFAAYFHFIRTDTVSYYVGSGIMPLLPKAYSYHLTLGMDFFWYENFRVFYNYRLLRNNASSYAFPQGTAFSAGFKYTIDAIRL